MPRERFSRKVRPEDGDGGKEDCTNPGLCAIMRQRDENGGKTAARRNRHEESGFLCLDHGGSEILILTASPRGEAVL